MAGGLVRAPDHDARLNAIQLALWQNLKPLLEAQRFQPPRVAELCAPLKLTEAAARRALKQFATLGFVEEVAPDHFFLRGAVADAAAIMATLGDNFGAARLRDRLDTGRKAAIELLEYFDRRGATVRRGDLRRVDPARLNLLLRELRAGSPE